MLPAAGHARGECRKLPPAALERIHIKFDEVTYCEATKLHVDMSHVRLEGLRLRRSGLSARCRSRKAPIVRKQAALLEMRPKQECPRHETMTQRLFAAESAGCNFCNLSKFPSNPRRPTASARRFMILEKPIDHAVKVPEYRQRHQKSNTPVLQPTSHFACSVRCSLSSNTIWRVFSDSGVVLDL